MPVSQNVTLELMANIAVAGPDVASGQTIAPEHILQLLARLRMLEGVPFNTLVPDTELLPNESIRFFYLDRAWTDALVQGALSVATANTVERAQLENLYPKIEVEIDKAERRVRSPGSEPVLEGTAGIVTGFLLRSSAVAGWPGLHVRAYRKEPGGEDKDVQPESHPDRIKMLRLERLSPSVLLALFDGIPEVLHIEEPRQGIQFGYKPRDIGAGRYTAAVPARNVHTAEYVDAAGGTPSLPNDAEQIPVRFRAGSTGVLDLSNTARAFADAEHTDMSTAASDPVDGAEFALQMIRFPYRQVFAQDTTTTAAQNDAFKPSLANVAERYTKLLQARIRED